MAKLVVVPKRDYEIISKYLRTGSYGVVLVPEDVLEELPDDVREEVGKRDGTYLEYDFGGEADVWVDIIVDKNSYAVGELLGST